MSMPVEPLTATIISATAAVVSAVAAGVAVHYSAAGVREARRGQELDVFDRAFTGIAQLEEKFYDAMAAGKAKEIFLPWRAQFLNRLEYLAFLVNSGYLRDELMVGYFSEAFVCWYEVIFEKHIQEGERDPKIYLELKALYSKLTYHP